ncbi:MAG: molybdopterin biosynthesis protein [Anaerolineales bacterium]
MSIYLRDIPLAEAKERLKRALVSANLWRRLGAETVPLDENALGRVLAEPVWARNSSPHYHAAAMDGFAVQAEATAGAQPGKPLVVPVSKGNEGLAEVQARYVDTGDPLPGWSNAVIPIENVEALDEAGRPSTTPRSPASVRIRAGIAPWSHVRPLGEDIVASELVLPAGRTLRPADLGAIAAAGYVDIAVSRRPRVAIIPTGSELVPLGSDLRPGEILEYNSLVLAAQIRAMGGEATRYQITPDDLDLIADVVRQASQEHDLVLLNAGSSAGLEDFSARVVGRLGELLVHGVAVRPGHPVILGMLATSAAAGAQAVAAKETPVVGVPGYPVSAALTLDIFVEPLMAVWLGRTPLTLDTIRALLARKLTSPAGDEDHVRVSVGKVGDRFVAAPLPRAAGVITSLVEADGLVVVPPGSQGLEAGEPVEVRLLTPRPELEQTILAIGSHDMSLDILSQYLAGRSRRFISSNVGSQGGLIALRRGFGHVAGSHLLDPSTGDYNIPAIRQYMPGVPVRVVALVGREQGLIVRKGNPSHIESLKDLQRGDVAFVNRQRGAGTRVLLDYHLGLLGIPASSIRGYAREEYTHLGLAAAIAGGRADCGLGIAAAARALELEFVPLFKERYDLVAPADIAGSSLLEPLWRLLQEADFRAAVAAMPGYDVSVMGRVILEGS